ncbi:MAG: tRNA (adenosine(37)-N6)-dimethylallyltransferase MiaA, partial [Victivallales bacterium]|nr:tRNA (adenosine(37)-N6)-dimethylallyltransferase MiaA [Victivallales bacterium]
GTAQPTEEEQREIPHHLVGCFDFNERIDVFAFQRLADQSIAEIRKRDRLPILVGGTGLYMRSVLYGLDDLPADLELRKKLNDTYDSDTAEEALKSRMAELDPEALARWGNCRRRLIRALEVYLLTGKSIIELQKNSFNRLRYPVEAYKFDLPTDELKKRISHRASKMLESGWIEEASHAISSGLLNSPTAYQAIGYRLIGEHLEGKLSFDQLHMRIATATWQFARRQRTWFRHQHPEATPYP